MGYRISILSNLPMHHDFYFILIGDYSIDDRINNLFRESFNYIADNIANSAIVQSTSNRKLEHDIYKSIEKHIQDRNKYGTIISSLESHNPGLLILDVHPSLLSDNSLIVFIPFTCLSELYKNNNDLIKELKSLAEGRDTNIIDKVVKKRGLVAKVWDSIIMEPNIGGFGINLKKIL